MGEPRTVAAPLLQEEAEGKKDENKENEEEKLGGTWAVSDVSTQSIPKLGCHGSSANHP